MTFSNIDNYTNGELNWGIGTLTPFTLSSKNNNNKKKHTHTTYKHKHKIEN